MPSKDERLEELSQAMQTLLSHAAASRTKPVPHEVLNESKRVLDAERMYQSRNPRKPKHDDTKEPEDPDANYSREI